MLEKLANIFRIPDLRKRVLFTLGLLAVYRLGSHIPTPGINADMLAQFFNQNSGSALGLVDLFSGGNLRRLTIFALGIMPYITASIIFQLLTVIYEPLAKLQKEGELGRRKITQWTRYVTVLLAHRAVVRDWHDADQYLHRIVDGDHLRSLAFLPMCVLTLTAGTAFIMWLGEQITERGIGNGMSLLIFTGIVVGLPRGHCRALRQGRDQRVGRASRRSPWRCWSLAWSRWSRLSSTWSAPSAASRCSMRSGLWAGKMMGGQSTHLPLKVNSGGVMPVIFASFHPVRAAAVLWRELLRFGPAAGHARSSGRSFARSLRVSPGTSCCTWSRSSSSPTSTSRSSSVRTTLPTTCGSTAALFPASVRASAHRTSSTMC